MKIHILSLFPEFFDSFLQVGLIKKAIQNSILEIHLVDIKKFGKKGRADDYPFGGGDGMLISYPALKGAMERIKEPGRRVVLSAQGEKWSSAKARQYSRKYENITLICGRYGGLDSRFIQDFADEEISIGDYILNGGEAAALVLIESLSRFTEGFLGNEESSEKESFEGSLLEGPSYTHPRKIEGHSIPEILFSGHHEKIKSLRFQISLLMTFFKRPDLLEGNKELLNQVSEVKEALSQLSDEELKTLGFCKKEGELLLYKRL